MQPSFPPSYFDARRCNSFNHSSLRPLSDAACSCEVLCSRQKAQISVPLNTELDTSGPHGCVRMQPHAAPAQQPHAAVAQLAAMGFSRDAIERALLQAGGHPERALEIIIGGDAQEHRLQESPAHIAGREMAEAEKRLRSRPPGDNLAMSIFLELPKKKKVDEGWILAKIQEAITLYGISTGDGAAQLLHDIMTDTLTLDKLARDSSAFAFEFQDLPVIRHQSAKAACIACGDEFSGSMLYTCVCEAAQPTSAHGGAAAAATASGGRICYPCLFDGLHSQFMDNSLPRCCACNSPLHQTSFNDILTLQDANFSTCLGNEPCKNSKVCTCGAVPPSMFAGFAAQNPESLKTHKKECSFALPKRMKNQADDLLTQSALGEGEFFVACPGAGCKSWVEVAVTPHPDTGKPIKVRQCVRCSACSTTFCPKCGTSPYHYSTECEDVAPLRGDYSEWMARGRQAFLRQRAEMDASFQKQLQDYEADKLRVDAEKKQLEAVAQQAAADEAYKAQNCKNCPSCGRIVMQNGGCDLMKCGEDYHGGNPPLPPPPSYLLSAPPPSPFLSLTPTQATNKWDVDMVSNGRKQQPTKLKMCSRDRLRSIGKCRSKFCTSGNCSKGRI
jgi:hypothetical protein